MTSLASPASLLPSPGHSTGIPGGVRISILTSQHLAGAKNLLREVFPGDPEATEDIEIWLAGLNTDGRESYWVALLNNEVIGISGLWAPGQPRVGWVSWLAVADRFRSLGIGKLLWSEVIDQARLWALSTLRVWTGTEYAQALSWYLRMGFSPIWQEGEDIVLDRTTEGAPPDLDHAHIK